MTTLIFSEKSNQSNTHTQKITHWQLQQTFCIASHIPDTAIKWQSKLQHVKNNNSLGSDWTSLNKLSDKYNFLFCKNEGSNSRKVSNNHGAKCLMHSFFLQQMIKQIFKYYQKEWMCLIVCVRSAKRVGWLVFDVVKVQKKAHFGNLIFHSLHIWSCM